MVYFVSSNDYFMVLVNNSIAYSVHTCIMKGKDIIYKHLLFIQKLEYILHGL